MVKLNFNLKIPPRLRENTVNKEKDTDGLTDSRERKIKSKIYAFGRSLGEGGPRGFQRPNLVEWL